MNINKIGVLDSGLGGLTVLKELINIIPENDYYYFGDTERMPFGNKSVAELNQIANEIVEFFIKKGVKIIIIACNTISALILDKIKNKYMDITFVGMIDPVIIPILKVTKNNNIGLMATLGTVNSKTHEKSLKKIDESINITNIACIKLVPLIEKEELNSIEIDRAVKEYTNQFSDNIDTVVLGCTHYPLIKNTIQKYLPNVNLIDPAIEVANKVKEKINNIQIKDKDREFKRNFYVTGDIKQFQNKAELFLDNKIISIEKVDLHKVINGGCV